MWEQIRANRRRSLMLMVGMFLVLVSVGYAAGVLMGGTNAGVFGLIPAIGIFLVQWMVFRFAGESVLLAGSGARELQREDSPRLFNIVEEMKLASGFEHMPRIMLIDDPTPNAFAVGRKPESCCIAVTSGLLYRLNRDELQGVIAHEMGHLKNRDVEFMTLAGVMLGSIIMLSELTWRMLYIGGGRTRTRSSSRSGGDGGGQAQLLILLLSVLVVALGPILAQILYFTTSRKREYLADACAAQYTRYPDGLASALEKIANAGSKLTFVSKATAPLFIVNPTYQSLSAEPSGLFSTHPPTTERVSILRSMGGASFLDYDKSFRQSGRNGVLGQTTLNQAQMLTKREPSGEGPIEQRKDARGAANRLQGYVSLNCDCGMNIGVPEGFELDTIRCVRCGRELSIPAATPPPLPTGAAASMVQEVVGAAAPPLQFARTKKGWETFRCTCGGTVQLSPQFAAPRTACPRCRRQIEVTQLPGMSAGIGLN